MIITLNKNKNQPTLVTFADLAVGQCYKYKEAEPATIYIKTRCAFDLPNSMYHHNNRWHISTTASYNRVIPVEANLVTGDSCTRRAASTTR